MAYMNQEHKTRIAALLKDVMPKTWKYSLSVRHHSTIVLTIQSAPVALDVIQKSAGFTPYNLKEKLSPEMFELFTKIYAALNLDNHDRSDVYSDYFDVGHYVDIQIGKWDKPFIQTPETK